MVKPLVDVCEAPLDIACSCYKFFCQISVNFSKLSLGAIEPVDWHEVAAILLFGADVPVFD